MQLCTGRKEMCWNENRWHYKGVDGSFLETENTWQKTAIFTMRHGSLDFHNFSFTAKTAEYIRWYWRNTFWCILNMFWVRTMYSKCLNEIIISHFICHSISVSFWLIEFNTWGTTLISTSLSRWISTWMLQLSVAAGH